MDNHECWIATWYNHTGCHWGQ